MVSLVGRKQTPSLPLFPMTIERARELVKAYGFDIPIKSRPRFCPPRRSCPTCKGKRAKGHGPYPEVGGDFLGPPHFPRGMAGELKVRELEAARAMLEPEFGELARQVEELKAKREALLNGQKWPKAAVVSPRPSGGAGAQPPTSQERRASQG